MKRRYTYTVNITEDVSYSMHTWVLGKLATLTRFKGDELDMIIGIL